MILLSLLVYIKFYPNWMNLVLWLACLAARAVTTVLIPPNRTISLKRKTLWRITLTHWVRVRGAWRLEIFLHLYCCLKLLLNRILRTQRPGFCLAWPMLKMNKTHLQYQLLGGMFWPFFYIRIIKWPDKY